MGINRLRARRTLDDLDYKLFELKRKQHNLRFESCVYIGVILPGMRYVIGFDESIDVPLNRNILLHRLLEY